MPEERPTVEDRILAGISRLDEKLEAFRERTEERFDQMERRFEARFGALERDVSELKGGFAQMDKRVTSLESLQRWAIGLIVTTWLTVSGLIIALFSRLP